MKEKLRGAAVAALVLGAGAAGLWLLLGTGRELPDGPVPIAWDREVCAECHMHIGDPRFAAQVQTRTGDVHSFDDPGCLYRQIEREGVADVHAIWFRHVDEDRWIGSDEVAFLSREPTPMGYGLGAVPRGTPDSFGPEDARARVLAHHGHARNP